MNNVIIEISIVAILLVFNGVFAMAEIAIVSSRKGILRELAEKGNRGAARALELAESPGRFLSTVQIGITLVGIVAGALGGGAASGRLAELLEPMLGQWAPQVALGLVITIITYFSLVVGELVPKTLAMKFPEQIAAAMSGPMSKLSTATSPVVGLLSCSTSGILRLFGIRESGESPMSREDFTVLVRQGIIAGSINRSESRMMEGVIGFGKLTAYDIMIPRSRIVWLPLAADAEQVRAAVMASAQSVFPIYKGRRDEVVGAVSLKDVYENTASGKHAPLAEIMSPPLFVPESQRADALLETFRSTGARTALVLDEFGGVAGMVTLIDLVETIIGEVPSHEEIAAAPIRPHGDGEWLIDGLYEIEKLPDKLEGFKIPEGGGDVYQTLAGWFFHVSDRLPAEGDQVSAAGWTFEIIDMDGPRVDKVLAARMKGHAGKENLAGAG